MNISVSLLCAWLVAHLLGLATAWLVRVHAGRRGETIAYCMFFMSLAVVAAFTLVGRASCWSTWTLSAATLSLMMVIAVADFGRVRANAMAIDG